MPSLAVPDAGLPVESLAGCEAVRLFLDRARAVHPDFALTSQVAPAVGQICRRLDGIPLALELAAARVRALTAEQLAARLDQRFRLLTGGSRTALPRQQTLRAAIDWSYDLLTEPERTLFARLSVFAGGWTLEAAEEVCAGDGVEGEDVLDLLARLVDRSLVVLEEGRSGEGRYRLLETLRHYGRERLASSGQAESVYARHAAHFLTLAEEAEPHLVRAEQLVWLDRLQDEYDNLQAALRWLLDSGRAEEGVRVVGALDWFWFYRAHFVDGQAWRHACIAATAGSRTRARAKLLGHAGVATVVGGDATGGRALLEDGLALGLQLGDQGAVAWATLWLFLAHNAAGDHAAADQRCAESLALYRKLEDPWGIPESLIHLGIGAHRRGEHDAARRLLDEALPRARRLGDRRLIAFALERLGELACTSGRYEDAHSLWEEGLARYQEIGDPSGVATVHNMLGDMGYLQRDYAAARPEYAASLQILRAAHYRVHAAWSLQGLALLAVTEQQPERAVRLAAASARYGPPLWTIGLAGRATDLEDGLAAARRALGEAAAAAALAEGQAMTFEQAVEYALEEDEGAG